MKKKIEALTELIESEGWQYFLEMLKDHGNYLQGEVNNNIRAGEYRNADRAQAKLEDKNKILELLNTEIRELARITEGDKNGRPAD